MKKQINFCVFILMVCCSLLVIFVTNIKIPSEKNLWVVNLLLSTTLLSLFIVIFGTIIYAKNTFLKTLDADTSVQEEFLRLSSIVSLPREILEKIPPEKMRRIITGETEKENLDEILEKASSLFSENLI